MTYFWKQLGTPSANLEQTHTIVKLIRDVLDAVAPHVAIVTETNVPHKENIKYFGNGFDEAQMVYNFALPPLVLHAFHSGNSSKLTEWAKSLMKVSDAATYFNFLDSHDGVGIQGAINVLSDEGINLLEKKAVEHGGFVSYKDKGDGTVSPYELNITWYSALNNEDANEPTDLQVRRFLASRSIALVLMGVPGIYLLSLFGSRNDVRAVLEGKNPRLINRRTICKEACNSILYDPESTANRINNLIVPMIEKRTNEKAFHPNSPQEVINVSNYLFAVIRTSADGREKIIAVTNITDKRQHCELNTKEFEVYKDSWIDILSGKSFKSQDGTFSFEMQPYEVLWMKAL